MQGLGDRMLRGALLGAGSIAAYHMKAWQAIPGVRIIAIANRTRDKAVHLGKTFGIEEEHIYSDYRELLEKEEVDFVDIATAPHVHREQVLAAAAAGVHILCQKPFALSISEAVEMIEACEEAGVRCVVNENWRWRRWYRELKGLLEEGRIGSPRYAAFSLHSDALLPIPEGNLPELLVRQPYLARMPRLILLEWGIHLIDVMRFLFGEIVRIYARMDRISPLVEGEDRAIVVLEFQSGMSGLIDVSWSSYIPSERRLARGNLDPFVIEGERGRIELNPYEGDVILISTSCGTERRPARSSISPEEVYLESFIHCQSHFIRSLRTGEPAESEARENLRTLAATLAAYLSAERGEPVVVNAMLLERRG